MRFIISVEHTSFTWWQGPPARNVFTSLTVTVPRSWLMVRFRPGRRRGLHQWHDYDLFDLGSPELCWLFCSLQYSFKSEFIFDPPHVPSHKCSCCCNHYLFHTLYLVRAVTKRCDSVSVSMFLTNSVSNLPFGTMRTSYSWTRLNIGLHISFLAAFYPTWNASICVCSAILVIASFCSNSASFLHSLYIPQQHLRTCDELILDDFCLLHLHMARFH